jgi:hypothetical protein
MDNRTKKWVEWRWDAYSLFPSTRPFRNLILHPDLLCFRLDKIENPSVGRQQTFQIAPRFHTECQIAGRGVLFVQVKVGNEDFFSWRTGKMKWENEMLHFLQSQILFVCMYIVHNHGLLPYLICCMCVG